MKKNILFIGLIVATSASVILVFQILSQPKANGFNRDIKHAVWTIEKVLTLSSSSFTFVNNIDSNLYLQDFLNPLSIYNLDYKAVRLNKISLELSQPIKRRNSSAGLLLSEMYLSNSNTDTLNVFGIKTRERKIIKLPLKGLDQINPISKNLLAFREVFINNGLLKRKLSTIRLSKVSFIINNYELDKQIDEYFSNDGILKYHQNNTRLYYAYYYRGEFLCLDTNLRLLYRAKTIDTIRVAKLNLRQKKKEGDNIIVNKITQANPPKIVIRNYFFYKDLLLVMSGLKADNESSTDFRNNQVIDVYKGENGKYLKSFYIPKYKGNKLREFRIISNSFLGIYQNLLVVYHLKSDVL